MIKILIIHAHWNNRGDEAALRAMIDELKMKYADCKIKVLALANPVHQFPYKGDIEGKYLNFPRKRDYFTEFPIVYLSKGKICLTKRSREFVALVQESDIVLHGPGGPSIGDIYRKDELAYLCRLLIVGRLKKTYAFYAPSMGPFNSNKFNMIRNVIRKKVLNKAALICLREPVSAQYVSKLKINKKPIVTLDSAFQHPIDIEKNKKIYEQYTELKGFIESYNCVIGITITDLMWNPKYRGNRDLGNNIKITFEKFIDYLKNKNYGVVFIPQLFGAQNDIELMREYLTDNCFIMKDVYDCYFQQFIISKMYALVGMRYHSNIFSAKMSRPFISIAYEQKMTGFMEKVGLKKYCISIDDLSFDKLVEKFEYLEKNWNKYQEILTEKSIVLQKEAYETTVLVSNVIDSNLM